MSKIPVSRLNFLDDTCKKNLNDCKIDYLFDVQFKVINFLMQTNNKNLIRPPDLCVSAPTGSGKTLAFVIPIVESLKKRVVCDVRALVVLPVIELACQVYKVFEMMVRQTDLKVVLLTGQKSFTAEQNSLIKPGIKHTQSLADIVVTTPGRILDHIYRTKGFSLRSLKYLVIDEADRMMEDIMRGWLTQIEEAVYKDNHIYDCNCFSVGSNLRNPSALATACSFNSINQPFQKLLFSATLSLNSVKLHSLSLYRPKYFICQETGNDLGKCPIPKNLTQQYIVCGAGEKLIVLHHYVMKNNFKKVLCFTQSIERAHRLKLIIEGMGLLKSKEISSRFSLVQRKIILDNFNSGKINVLVCSDLVARGMDLKNVDCVVSYDVPKHPKTYIHRIGRTARAGKCGTAVTLITEGELKKFENTLEANEIALPVQITIETENLEKYVNIFQNTLSTMKEKPKRKIKKKSRDAEEMMA